MADWDPYDFQVPPEGQGVVGRGILVMLLILVGLLEFMAAGSKILVGALRGDIEHWVAPSLILSVISVAYFTLAHGVWALRSWVPLFTALLTVLLVTFNAVRFLQDPVPDLALALVFLLAISVNLGLIGWAIMPATRRLLREEDGHSEPKSES